MKKIIVIILALISLSFYTIQKQTEENKIEKTIVNNEFVINDLFYKLQINIDDKINQKPTLVIAIELKNGGHYISPFAKRDFKGKFYLDLGSYKDVNFESEIIETPRSVEEYDPHPFTNGIVNWVSVNTVYKQELNIKTLQNFEVFGRVRFTIEPRCTLEEIPFAISFKDGKYEISSPKC